MLHSQAKGHRLKGRWKQRNLAMQQDIYLANPTIQQLDALLSTADIRTALSYIAVLAEKRSIEDGDPSLEAIARKLRDLLRSK